MFMEKRGEMKTSSSAGKSTAVASLNSKSKKNSKDREKRKSSGPDKADQLNNDKGSPNKDGNLRKYVGIGPDSILVCSEQSMFEHLSEEVCYGLAEDLSYKLRYIIHDALIKARLTGRNHILSSDIDAAFEDLNIERIYGATSSPNWVPFGEQNLFYLDDAVVNLVELAEQDCSYIQPGDVTMTRKWLPDGKEVGKTLKNYFETMCLAVVSEDEEVRKFALGDISENNFIGPVVEWFYHFGYFLLSKDITYDSLTLRALNLINALEQSHVAPLTVSEKQLKLLVRLILQRLLRSATTTEVLKPMCHLLAILCDRIPIRELVLIKLAQKISGIESTFVLPIISIINALGIDAVQEVFVPNMDFFLRCAEEKFDVEFLYAISQTYSIVCRHTCINPEQVHDSFHKVFGTALCPIWRTPSKLDGLKRVCAFKKINPEETPVKTEVSLGSNWFNIKSQLLKTRRKLAYSCSHNLKCTVQTVFEDYSQGTGTAANSFECETSVEEDNDEQSQGREDKPVHVCMRFKRSFAKSKFDVKLETSRLISLLKNELDIYNPDSCAPDISFISQLMDSKPKLIIVGKTSLLIPVLKGSKCHSNSNDKCLDHSLMCYNL